MKMTRTVLLIVLAAFTAQPLLAVTEAPPRARRPAATTVARVVNPVASLPLAEQVTAQTQPPVSGAVQGDYVLRNGVATFVINNPARAQGNAVSGGYVTAAYLDAQPVNEFRQLHLFLNDKYPRMAHFETARTINEDGVAMVEVQGTDTYDPTVDIVTTYSVTGTDPVLKIDTAVIPRSRELTSYPIGDAFAWGAVQQFVPGKGAISGGRIRAPWIGGSTRNVAFGLFTKDTELWGPAGADWADVSGTTVSLQAGQPGMYQRYLAVSRDLAGIQKLALETRGTSMTQVTGTVNEDAANMPAEGVRIIAQKNGHPVTEAMSSKGKFSMWLTPGTYTIAAQDRVRASLTPPADITVPSENMKPVAIRVSSPASLHLVVRDANTSELLPAKAIFLGRNSTKDPDLGARYESRGLNICDVSSGDERIPLPAGDYDLVIARGVEYDLTTCPITLKSNTETVVNAALKHSVHLDGWLSGDFHEHMENSFDSAVSLPDRVKSNACEGVQLLVTTDHNFITDIAPVINALKLERWITSIPGEEITTREFFYGHFNTYPIDPITTETGNGAIDVKKRLAADVFEEALSRPGGERVLQVNHPRSGDLGYFNHVHLDLTDGTTTDSNWSDKFTAIELWNGKRFDDFEDVVPDWFNLLNLGYKFTATGNSDSHSIQDHEPGYPRNYVHVGSSNPRDLKREVLVKTMNKDHASFVTNGPIITFETESGSGIGSSETITTGPVKFRASVLGPNYVQPSRVELYANGKRIAAHDIAETSAPLKWEGTFSDDPTTDTWYVMAVLGTHSLQPVLHPMGTRDVGPGAITNPIWIDRNGDGKFTAIHEDKKHIDEQDRRAEGHAQLDEMTSRSQQRNRFTSTRRALSTQGQ